MLLCFSWVSRSMMTGLSRASAIIEATIEANGLPKHSYIWMLLCFRRGLETSTMIFSLAVLTVTASARSRVPVRTDDRAASKSAGAGLVLDIDLLAMVEPGVVISRPMSSGLGPYFTMNLLGRRD